MTRDLTALTMFPLGLGRAEVQLGSYTVKCPALPLDVPRVASGSTWYLCFADENDLLPLGKMGWLRSRISAINDCYH